jgi:tRNA threonylcarbamoyladenosine biosynthesis protein TsaB
MTQGHGRYLLGMIDALWAEAGVIRGAVDALAFGCGPGSFTSLRLACGVTQGLAMAWEKPVLGVDAMRTLAFQAQQAAGSDAGYIWVTLDVRMGEVCHAVYPARGWEDGTAQALWPPALGRPEQAIAAIKPLIAQQPGALFLAGDGPDAYPSLIEWVRGQPIPVRRHEAAVQPDARAVAHLARHDARKGLSRGAALTTPWYVRDKVALNVSEQQALRAQRSAVSAAIEAPVSSRSFDPVNGSST